MRIEIPQVREAMPFVSKLFPKWHCKRLLRTDPLKALIVGGSCAVCRCAMSSHCARRPVWEDLEVDGGHDLRGAA